MIRLLLFLLLATAAHAQVAVRIGAETGVTARGVALVLDGTLDAVGPLATAGATITFTDPSRGGLLLTDGLGVRLVRAADFVGTAVGGSVQISGPLRLTVAPGVRIEAGDTFDVLTCSGTCAGPFGTVQSPFAVDVTYGGGAVTVQALVGYTEPVPGAPTASVVIAGRRGFRYLGSPVEGLTVDDLAAQNLVRGVPGYFEADPDLTLWTAYDPLSMAWVPSAGVGEALQLGRAFRWELLDVDGVGDPAVSVSRALPFVLSTGLPVNTGPVPIELVTRGTRFIYLANPFNAVLDVSGIRDWPGGDGVAPRSAVYTYDPETASWDEATTVAPWQAFRFRARALRRKGNPHVLTIPAHAAQATATRQRADARSEAGGAARPALSFALAATADDGGPLRDGALTVSFGPDATAAFDADEDTEKFQPPSTAYALVGARTGRTFAGHDVRPFGPAEIALAVEARGAQEAMTLSWDASALPAGLPVVLVDLATGAEVDVRRQSSVTFRHGSRPVLDDIPMQDLADGSAATDRFVLRIGEARVEATDVTELALETPAPNPSSGAARLSFAMPQAGPVRLAVYDVRGREVARLVEGARDAGWHDAALPRGLAAGVYVVRLEALGQVLTQRATVVR